jgi:superfamily II DNA or RNA helicase
VLTLVHTVTGEVIDIPLNEYLQESATFRHVHKLFAPERGIDFERRDDPDVPPYFLGLWIGDGTKALNNVAISKPDVEVLDECERVAVANGGYVRTYNQVGKTCPTYFISTPRGQPNRLLRRLRTLMGNGDMPLSVLTASRTYRAQVLAGIIDTDGYHNRGCVEIAQKSVPIADGIKFLARSLGLRATSSVKTVNGQQYQRMSLSGDFSEIPTRIARKTPVPRRINKVATRSGFSVHSVGDGEYAGFTLDGDGRYLMGDFTVTHNTVYAAAIVESALSKGKRVTFGVSSLSLIDQTVEKFYAEGIRDIGVIQASHPMEDWAKPVQIASVQTLDSRKVFPDSTVNIFDECHVLYKAHKAWLAASPESIFIGLSATPYTKGLGGYFETMIPAMSTRDAIAANILVPGRYFAHAHPDLKGKLRKVAKKVSTETGETDYARGELAGVMRDNEISADVVNTWQKRWGKGHALVFAVDLGHAQDLHARFEAAGVRCAYQDANTKRNGYWTTGDKWVDGRADIARKFNSGDIDVAVSVGTLTTGVDWDVRYIALARPTKSEILYKQIIGRGLRPGDGKDCCIIADHGGVCQELGFAEDIEYDELHKKEVRERKHVAPVKKPKLCLSCGYLRSPGPMACANCGFQSAPVNKVCETDDELEYVDRHTKPKGAKREWTIEEKADFFAQLKSYSRTKGFKPGWAPNKYRDKFGVWPNEPRIKHAPSQAPTPSVLSWIKSTQIAWAKSKRNPQNSMALA